MKPTLLAAALAAILAALSSCGRAPASIDVSAPGAWTLDSGDGRIVPYDGGKLPEPAREGRATWRFERSFSVDPDGFPSGPSLVIGPSMYPYELYVNGRFVWRHGERGDDATVRSYATTAIRLPRDLLARENRIVVLADVDREREPLMEISVADDRAASSWAFWRDFFMRNLSNSSTVTGLMLAAYFVALFLIGKAKDWRFLWFALFCASFSLVCVNLSLNHFGGNDALVSKLSRLGLFGSAVFMTFYVMEVTRTLHRKRWIKVLALAGMAAGVAVTWMQRGTWHTLETFKIALQFAITPHLVASVVLVVRGVVKDGLRRHFALVIGFTGTLATSVYDMVYETAGFTPYAWVLSYGYLWLVVCLFFELAIEQEGLKRRAMSQAEDLDRTNRILGSVFTRLREGSDTLAASTEDLAVSTREISATGAQQAAAVREIVATVESAGSHVAKVSSMSGSVREDSEGTARRAEEGAAAVKDALEKLEAVIGRISQSITIIAEFDEQLGSIKDVVKLVEGIATQIRIIAFNASLEAVAAGEAGRNFRIVAEEVKRLADSAMSSVKGIRERVNSLVSQSEKVVQVARDGYRSLEQSWDIASGMGSSFSDIAEAAESSARATAEIDASIREESVAFDQIVLTLREISSGVNSFVDSASHTSETTHRLNDIAEELHSMIVEYAGGGDGKRATATETYAAPPTDATAPTDAVSPTE